MPNRLLAATPSPTPAPIDPARVTPGVLGLVFVLVLAVAVFFLWRSMNKQITGIEFTGSVPVDPDDETGAAADPAAQPGAEHSAEASATEGAIEAPAPGTNATDAVTDESR